MLAPAGRSKSDSGSPDIYPNNLRTRVQSCGEKNNSERWISFLRTVLKGLPERWLKGKQSSLLCTKALLNLLMWSSCQVFAWQATTQPMQEVAIIPAYQQLQRLNQYPVSQGQAAMVLLFGADCRFCKQQARLMASQLAKCPQASMVLVGVQGSRGDLLNDLRQLQTPLPAFLADGAFLRSIGGVQAVPTTLLLNSEGSLLVKHRGMLDAQQVLLVSEQLLAPNCLAKAN